MKFLIPIILCAVLSLSKRAFSENSIANDLSDFVSLIEKSQIAAVIEVDNGKQKISEILKGDIKKFPWIAEGEYAHVGKVRKKMILYVVTSSLEGVKRVKVWQIKHGIVQYSINGRVKIEELKLLIAQKHKILE